MSESYQKSVEKMQSLGESMEEIINQLRQNPEGVCDRTVLMVLTQKVEKVCNEVDSCRKDILTSNDTAQLEDKKKECESKVTEAQDEITGLKNSISYLEREIRECEQQIGRLEQTYIGFNAAGAAYLASSIMNPAAIVCAIFHNDKREEELREKHNTKDFYQNQMNDKKVLIESKLKDIERYKYEYQECREMAVGMISFKKALLHWLQFLKDLTLKMNRLQNAFDGALAVKDTGAYQDYVKFINGSDAKKSLKFAKNMRQITSMDPLDIILSFQSDD